MATSASFDPVKLRMPDACSDEGLGGIIRRPGSRMLERIRQLLRGSLRLDDPCENVSWDLEPEISDKDLEGKATPQEDWAAYSEAVLQKNRGKLYGASYDKASPLEEDSEHIQRSEERRQFFASLGSVGELKDFMFNIKEVVYSVVCRSTSAGFLNISVSEEFRTSLLKAMKSRNWEEVESMVMPIAAALPRRAAIYEAFIVLASLLVSAIFQYLMALSDKVGTKTHSSGSREFRSRYICIVLFQGAYVWIKFREVAPESLQKAPRGLHRSSYKNEFGGMVYFGKYEPRVKPAGCSSYVSVGSFEKEQDAMIMLQIVRFICGKKVSGKLVSGELPLQNGETYPIPCMSEEQRRLHPDLKKEVVKVMATSAYKEFEERLKDSQGVQATGDTSNPLPPDAGAGCDAHPVQLGNRRDGMVEPVSPRNSSPYVGPEIQVSEDDDSYLELPAADAFTGVGDGPPTLEGLPPSSYLDSQGVQATGYISNNLPPDAGGGAVQLFHEGDGLNVAVAPSNCIPNVGPEIPMHVAGNSCNDHSAAAGAGVRYGSPLDAHFQHHALVENQANDVNPDDLSVLRELKVVQRQQQLQQLQIQQQETRIQQLEFQSQQQEIRIQQQDIRSQQQESRISELERRAQRHALLMEQKESRISELEGEVERLRSTEPARKRICVGLSLTHNSQN